MAVSFRPEHQPRIVRFPSAPSQEALVELANSMGAFAVSVQLSPNSRLTNAQAEFALQIQRAALVQFRNWLPGAEGIERATAGGRHAAALMARRRVRGAPIMGHRGAVC